ncbi:hypothetical protein BGW38_009148, partial [Lunasporangiospora selenospora]
MKITLALVGLLSLALTSQAEMARVQLKKADVTPAQAMLAYSETGSYIAQKYFGSGSANRKVKADQMNQILGFDAEGKPSYGVPLSNYLNAQ